MTELVCIFSTCLPNIDVTTGTTGNKRESIKEGASDGGKRRCQKISLLSWEDRRNMRHSVVVQSGNNMNILTPNQRGRGRGRKMDEIVVEEFEGEVWRTEWRNTYGLQRL